MSLDCSTPTCFLYMTNKFILFKGAHFYIFVHVLYLNTRYIFVEYKKDDTCSSRKRILYIDTGLIDFTCFCHC